jgi:acetyltransferase-like isoleucine patch superfamily enzyme
MKKFFKNTLTVWMLNYINNRVLEYKNRNLSVGRNTHIKKCFFGKYNTIYHDIKLLNVIVNDFSYIGPRTQMNNANIGKFCSIGPDCRIGLGRHPSKIFVSTHPIFFSTRGQSQITFSDKNYFGESEKIMIGNDVWIGSNSIILDGVKVHTGAILAAGSVVTKDVQPYAIVGGVPAKVIGYRFEAEQVNKLLKSKWWDKDIEYLKNNYHKFHNIQSFFDV